MRIGNLRIGFATNSSSSHSIIIVKDPNKVTTLSGNSYDGGYGWENFILKDEDDKLHYLAAQMKTALGDVFGDKICTLIVNDFFKDAIDHLPSPGSVDHQSALSLPVSRNKEYIPEEFYQELKSFFQRQDIVIVGGNDNSDEDLLDTLKTKYEKVYFPEIYDNIWVKKQKKGWWTFFSPNTGNKLTFNFSSNAQPLEKAVTPDLIDMKITDYCESGCIYCYQDSSRKGKHAEEENIRNLIRPLKDMNVFEIALGGGEATKHPDFLHILRMIREENIIPNFSTKSFEWMRDTPTVMAVNKYAGKVGFSCSSVDEVRALTYHIEKSGLEEKKFTVHYVLGSNTINEFEKIVRSLANTGMRLLILGYKKVGRGCNFTPYDNSQWPSIAMNYWIEVGVDTCAAKQYKKDLKNLRVNDKLYFTEEGKFSMYIDAVESKVARSSFEKNPGDYTSIKELLGAKGWDSVTVASELVRTFNGY